MRSRFVLEVVQSTEETQQSKSLKARIEVSFEAMGHSENGIYLQGVAAERVWKR
jgi:hypothetical protein